MLMFGIVLQFYVQTFASYVSGLNVNYQLYPPSIPEALDFMLGPDYRWKFFVVLAIFSLLKKALIEQFARFLIYIGLGTQPSFQPNFPDEIKKKN